jgi:DNA relaxase NicK
MVFPLTPEIESKLQRKEARLSWEELVEQTDRLMVETWEVLDILKEDIDSQSLSFVKNNCDYQVDYFITSYFQLNLSKHLSDKGSEFFDEVSLMLGPNMSRVEPNMRWGGIKFEVKRVEDGKTVELDIDTQTAVDKVEAFLQELKGDS